MRSTLQVFKVLIIMFWVGVLFGFGLYVFFGEQINSFFHSIPVLVDFKEYMGFTQENVESFIVFWTIFMVPASYLVLRLTTRMDGGQQRTEVPVRTTTKPKVVQAKNVKPVKVVEDKVVYAPSKGIGLTGLIIK